MGKDTPKHYGLLAEKHFEALYAGGEFVTSRDAARITGVGKSTAATLMKWFRSNWQAVQAAPEADAAAEPVAEALLESDKTKTWTDERSGTVFTNLGEYGIFTLTEGQFRAIKREYSKLWGGRSATMQEVVYRHGFPTISAFDQFRKIHELRQTSIPFTDTEIETEEIGSLVERTLESRKQQFFLTLQAKERDAEKRDAEKWRAFEVNAHMIAAEVKGLAAGKPLPIRTAPQDAALFMAIINLQDLHHGKLAYNSRGERTYDRQESARRFRVASADLLGQVSRHGQPETIALVVGGDLLHSDSSALKTTRGTEQGGQSDGSYREILAESVGLVMEQIKAARVIAPVQVWVVYGNHDEQSNLFLGLLLEQAFAGDHRVNVVHQSDGCVIENYGNATIMVSHGENVKDSDAYRIIGNAAQAKGLPLMGSKLMLTGHRHHTKMIDLNGVELHQCPSLSEADAWHVKNFYSGAAARAEALILDKVRGKSAVFYTENFLSARTG